MGGNQYAQTGAEVPDLAFLKGKKLRVLKPDEVGTTEFDEDRLTAHVDQSGRIINIGIN